MKVNIFETFIRSLKIQPLFRTGGDLSGRFSNNGINSAPASSPVICFSSCSTQSALVGGILALRAHFVTLDTPLLAAYVGARVTSHIYSAQIMLMIA